MADRGSSLDPNTLVSLDWGSNCNAICSAAAGCGGWVVAGGDPLVAAVADWLALNSNSGMVGSGDRALLEITSQPDGALVFVDGHQKGKTPLALATSKAM